MVRRSWACHERCCVPDQTLAGLTTLRVGGPADALVQPADAADNLREALRSDVGR